MLFNSFTFLVFFPLVYALYLASRRQLALQNTVLLLASYVFYGWWSLKFLGLLLLTTLLDWTLGRAIGRRTDPRERRAFVAFSVCVNLGLLGFFKYHDFFADAVLQALAAVGLHASIPTLHVVLPVGISFYTFQSMAYVIDVSRGVIEPVQRLRDFALYVAFFPQLVAGPIERGAHMLPQLARLRVITPGLVREGVWLVLWGFFKKLVVADNLARIADEVFLVPQTKHGLDLLLGALAFTGQIYGDFSGYSDIARGIARLLGFELMLNFRLPYLARNPRDFWSRWHISLSTWLRDYLYVSLGGNRRGQGRTLINLTATMLLGGLWHGASWTFVVWGLFHGSWLAVHRVLTGGVDRPPRSAFVHALSIVGTFLLTAVGWVIFRAHNGADAAWILTHLSLTPSASSAGHAWRLFVFWLPLMMIDAVQARSGDLMVAPKLPALPRSLVYALLFCAILAFGARTGREFIYFQF